MFCSIFSGPADEAAADAELPVGGAGAAGAATGESSNLSSFFFGIFLSTISMGQASSKDSKILCMPLWRWEHAQQ